MPGADASALPAGPMPLARRRRRSRLGNARRRAGIMFSLPVLLLTAGLLFLPIVQTLYYSFTEWDGISSTPVGLTNYQALFNDSTFWRVLLNNVFLLLSIPIAILIPLVIAFLLNERVMGWRLFRSAYFLPTAISWVVIGMVAVRVFASS